MLRNLRDLHRPSFLLFPHHTDRTGWAPFGLPVLLVVPHVVDSDGTRVANANVQSVRIYITAQGQSPVAGHDHVGIYVPDYDIYSKTLDFGDLLELRVQPNQMTLLDANEQPVTDSSDATYVEITLASGVTARTQYIPHADYFDLSTQRFDVESLPESKYWIVYEATYFARDVSDAGELLCIRDDEAIATYRFLFNHPGEVLLMMVEGTPQVYFTSANKSEDDTIAFYRPFSEILQDIHDEQALLKQINWIHTIEPQYIPYLGFLLGWELPYYPNSTDAIRRALLRRMVHLQRLKGCRRAIRELFDLLGFFINVGNVWWSPDGKRLIGQDEPLPPQYQQYAVTSTRTATTEPLLLEFTEDGFGQTTVPLIHQPASRSMTIRAYVVRRGSAAHSYLQSVGAQLSTDLEALDYDAPPIFTSLRSDVTDVESKDGVVGSTTAIIDSLGYVSSIETSGEAPITERGLKHDYITNVMSIQLDRYWQFDSDGLALYVFATYIYDKITVPSALTNLRSNRFDLEIIQKEGEFDPTIVAFLLDLLSKLKPFHSLLRKLILEMANNDVYQVTDFSRGGDVAQDINYDAGRQQVPPEAIIPEAPGECPHYKPEDWGFRRWDIEYREKILEILEDEFNAWSRVEADCAANPRGQDRSTTLTPTPTTSIDDSYRVDTDSSRDTACEAPTEPFCYLGRPKDSTAYKDIIKLGENWWPNACDLKMGNGVYYSFDVPAYRGSSVQNKYLADTSAVKSKSRMGRLLRGYSTTTDASIHYSSQPWLDGHGDGSRYLGILRPSLGIQRDNLSFPGHRLPTMNGLAEDFVHPQWEMRPWDYDIVCSGGSPRYQNPLNARLVEDSSGNETLVFDSMPYSIDANGIEPDISSLGAHDVGSGTTISSADNITHAIYSGTSGHPAITLYGTVDSIGVVKVDEALFKTGGDCEESVSTGSSGTEITAPDQGTIDWSDGYPADTGQFSYGETTDYFPASDDSTALADALGLPGSGTGTGTGPVDLLFKLISQIKVETSDPRYDRYRHLRLDCGCSHICLERDIKCPLEQFIEQYGVASTDVAEAEESLVFSESLGSTEPLYGSLMFCVKQSLVNGQWVLDANGEAAPQCWPDSGSFIYQDDYGTIYDTSWTTTNNYVDFTTTIKEPRVWGQPDATRIVNHEVYKRGIVTTIRNVFKIIGDGEFELAATGLQDNR